MKEFISKHGLKIVIVILVLFGLNKCTVSCNRGNEIKKLNTDIELPMYMNVQDAESFKEKIDKIIEIGDLSKFMEYKDIILTKED